MIIGSVNEFFHSKGPLLSSEHYHHFPFKKKNTKDLQIYTLAEYLIKS